MPERSRAGLLMVANYDASVGYAWWLMESFWVELSKLYGHRMDAHLAYPSVSTIPEVIENSDIFVHAIDFTSTRLQNVYEQLYFLRKQSVRTLYFSDQSPWHWRYLLYRLAGVRTIVIHDHTPGQRVRPKGIKKLVKSMWMRLPLITASAIIGATDFVRCRAIEVTCFPESKTFSAPNGIPSGNSDSEKDVYSAFDIPRDRQVVVSTGRATMYKGIGFALECLAELLKDEKNSRVHFLFCGDGPDMHRFKSIAQSLGIESHVTFPGRVENIHSILRACDFAFHPSKGEVGYSLSIIEYMQAGLPVVVPDNPSVCGAIEHERTGLIYREADKKSATDSLGELLHSANKRVELGANAKKMARDKFSLESTHLALRQAMQAIDRNIFVK